MNVNLTAKVSKTTPKYVETLVLIAACFLIFFFIQFPNANWSFFSLWLCDKGPVISCLSLRASAHLCICPFFRWSMMHSSLNWLIWFFLIFCVKLRCHKWRNRSDRSDRAIFFRNFWFLNFWFSQNLGKSAKIDTKT